MALRRRSVFSSTHGSSETEPLTSRELRQPTARRKTASHPLFLLDFLRRTLQRNQTSKLVRNLRLPTWRRDWPVASITSHRDPDGPTLPPQARMLQMLRWVRHVIAPYQQIAVSTSISHLFSSVIVGPSAGNHDVDAVTMGRASRCAMSQRVREARSPA